MIFREGTIPRFALIDEKMMMITVMMLQDDAGIKLLLLLPRDSLGLLYPGKMESSALASPVSS